MLDKNVFDNFIRHTNIAWQCFCVFKYSNNNYADNYEMLKSESSPGLYKIDEAVENSSRYKNFWEVTLYSLFQSMVLSVARLLDPSVFEIKKTKEKRENLGIEYLKSKLAGTDQEEILKNFLDMHKIFIESIKAARNRSYAHNDMGENERIIKSGIEDFFEGLSEIVENIKKNFEALENSNSLSLEYTEKLSQSGVEDIFRDLLSSKI